MNGGVFGKGFQRMCSTVVSNDGEKKNSFFFRLVFTTKKTQILYFSIRLPESLSGDLHQFSFFLTDKSPNDLFAIYFMLYSNSSLHCLYPVINIHHVSINTVCIQCKIFNLVNEWTVTTIFEMMKWSALVS